MANILVIGGAGFVGTNLCKYLLNDPKNMIYVLDNYFTGSEANHIKSSRIHYTYGMAQDIRYLFVPGVFNFDYIYHFGEYSRVEQSYYDLDAVMFLNLQLHKVLEYCIETGAKLIYSGSSTKFSSEGSSLSPYAWTKCINTDLIQKYNEWFGIDYAIVYFYNVYGPHEIEEGKYATLIGRYKRLQKEGKPLKVTLPGTQVRNFTHIEDTVRALELVAKHGHGDGYGIGSPTAYSVETVAHAFSDNVEYVESPRGNRMSAEVVSDKTRALGWEPEHDLLEYIERIKV